MARRRPDAEPLTVLLAKTWTAHTMEIDNAVESAGSGTTGRMFKISLAMWANGLRLIDEAGISLGELRVRARAACNIGGLERWKWITVDVPRGADASRREGYGTSRGLRSASVLRPTRAGTAARRRWPAAVEAVEDRWRHRFGDAVVDALRTAAATRARAMPWAVPEVAPSDGFLTHLVEGDHGDPGSLPLVVLIGETLTALTVQAEAGAPVSLPLGENLLRTLDDTAVAVKDLPARTGLSREAVAMAVGFIVRRKLASMGPGRALTLTTRGSEALRVHRARVAAVAADADDLRASLEAVLSQPAALAKGLEPPAGGWRGERPYLTRTRHLLEDPVGALPRHPMVLHRGGWPDGS